MSVRVSVTILVALGMIAYVNSLSMTVNTFEQNGGLRICYGDFNNLFKTICQSINRYASGQCGSIKIQFSDDTVSRQVLVCKGADNSVVGCAYASSGSGTDYKTTSYNKSGGYCY